MAKEKFTGTRQQYTPEQKAEFQKQKRDEARTDALQALTLFLKKANITEAEDLMAYVDAKNYADNNINERMSNTRILVLRSKEAVDMMSALPAIDKLLTDSFEGIDRVSDKKSVLEAFEIWSDTKFNLIDVISKQIIPMVDIACEKSLIRDRRIINEWTERKTLKNKMAFFGIDPNAPDAQALYEQAVIGKKAQDQEEAIRVAAVKELEKKDRERIVNEQRQANIIMMKALGIDSESKGASKSLSKVKAKMKEFGIDPASSDAVIAYQISLEEATTHTPLPVESAKEEEVKK